MRCATVRTLRSWRKTNWSKASVFPHFVAATNSPSDTSFVQVEQSPSMAPTSSLCQKHNTSADKAIGVPETHGTKAPPKQLGEWGMPQFTGVFTSSILTHTCRSVVIPD